MARSGRGRLAVVVDATPLFESAGAADEEHARFKAALVELTRGAVRDGPVARPFFYVRVVGPAVE